MHNFLDNESINALSLKKRRYICTIFKKCMFGLNQNIEEYISSCFLFKKNYKINIIP